MPTPISVPDKQAVIALVTVVDPVEANNLSTVLVNYDDVIHLIARQAVEFEYYPSYLTEVMACLTDGAALLAAGIYVNQASIGNNPKVIINSTVTGNVTFTANSDGLGIFNSTVPKIILQTNVTLSDLWLASGSKLSMLDSTAAGSYVENIWIRNLRGAPASLLAVAVGSNINVNGVNVDDGAYYGGITNNDQTAACANPVTGLTVSEQMHDTLKLTWVPPANNFIAINVFYKRSDAPVWIICDTSVGDYLANNTGFVFRTLDKDTNYDFNVVVTCNNGGEASVIAEGITTCC